MAISAGKAHPIFPQLRRAEHVTAPERIAADAAVHLADLFVSTTILHTHQANFVCPCCPVRFFGTNHLAVTFGGLLVQGNDFFQSHCAQVKSSCVPHWRFLGLNTTASGWRVKNPVQPSACPVAKRPDEKVFYLTDHVLILLTDPRQILTGENPLFARFRRIKF